MRGDHKDSERTDRHSSRVASAASPVQKSPNTPTPAAQPVQNSPNTPKKAHFSQFCPSRENFVPHQAPNPVQNSPNTPTPAAQPVQNSPCSAGPGAHPVQNSPNTPTPAAQPVQNSPNTPKNAHFSQFCPSGENFVPHPPPRPPAGRTLYRSHHHDAQQGELCTAPSTTPGTKLSQHTHTSSPTGTKLSPHIQKSPFQPVLPEQGELCTASIPTTPSRENFVPHPAPPRHKTRPAHPHQQPNRYKTLPTRPKTPISASFARAGRTLYRSHHHDAQQGELCTAPSAKPGTKLSLLSRSVGPTGTKLSQHAHTSSPTGTKLSQHTPPAAQPVQNSPNTPTPAAQPVQNSPNTHKKAHFSLFCPSRENYVPLAPPRPPAGRTLYRTKRQTRYKTLPAHPFYSGSAKKFAQHT